MCNFIVFLPVFSVGFSILTVGILLIFKEFMRYDGIIADRVEIITRFCIFVKAFNFTWLKFFSFFRPFSGRFFRIFRSFPMRFLCFFAFLRKKPAISQRRSAGTKKHRIFRSFGADSAEKRHCRPHNQVQLASQCLSYMIV